MTAGNVIDTLVVRLVGDNSDYKKAMNESKAVMKAVTSDMSSRLRDARGRFVADQKTIQAEIAQTNRALASMKAAAAQAGNALASSVKAARSAGNQIGSALGSLQGQVLAAAGVGSIGGLMMKAVNDASNNAENLSKFGAVFAEHTAQAQAFTADLADTIGRSESEIRTALSAYQAFGIGLGFSKDKSYELSTTMEKLSLDFAAFHNIQDDEAMQRFVSAMSGSSEVLDQFGINIRQAALQEELFAMGINKSVTEATEAEKTMARLNIVMEAMGEQGAVGAAARESGSFANQLKGLKAEALDLSIAVGNDLMPMALDTLKWLKGLVTQAGAAEGGMTSIGSAFLTVADVLHTLGIGFQGLQAAITRIIATSISGINRLVQSIPGAGKLGVADVTQSAADTFQAEAKKQDAEYFAALEAQTPSEKWANREAAAPPPEIEREVKKLAMEATVDLNKAFSDAAKSFGSEVVDYGELFGLKISNFGYSWMMDAVNLYNNPAKVDGFAKASAGTAVEFGSAESIISQSQKTGEDSIEKNTKELVVNAYAQKRLQEKTAAATEGIFKSFGSLISIPR